jgi:hypothetical protein
MKAVKIYIWLNLVRHEGWWRYEKTKIAEAFKRWISWAIKFQFFASNGFFRAYEMYNTMSLLKIYLFVP